MIVTDGDPLRRGEVVHAGLARAVKLLPAGTDRAVMQAAVDKCLEAGATADTAPTRVMAMKHGIFVGHQTLEIDLTPLLAAQMIAAHGELEASPGLITNFEHAVTSVAGGTDDPEQREELLRRIEHVSKGRFAQRLAAHIDDTKPSDLEKIIIGEIPAEPSPLFSDREAIAQPSYGYILAALDHVSRQVRGHGLMTAEPPRPGTDEG